LCTGPDHADLLDAWLALTDDAVAFAGPVRLPMLSGSMAPRIPVGADLVIVPADSRGWGTGDVVVFVRDGRLVAHRVLLMVGRGPAAWLLEKGDRNVGAGWIRRRDVRGLVIDRVPNDPRRRYLPLREPGTVRESVVYSLRILARRLLGRTG
jgi:hypothetical protein